MADTLEFNEIYQEVKGSMVSELGRGGSPRGDPLGPWRAAHCLETCGCRRFPPPGISSVLAEDVLLISLGSGGASFPGLKHFGASTGAFSASPLWSERGCGWERFQEEGAGMPTLCVHPFTP